MFEVSPSSSRGRSRAAALLLPVVIALLVLPSIAPAQGGRGAGQRMFDPATVTTVEGEVQELWRVPAGRWHEGVHLRLSTGTEALDVHLGPEFFVDDQALKLAKGDRIQVKGSRLGDTTLIAQEVRRGEERMVLRNAAGVPAWAGAGAGARRRR